jgi:hypothetical protein
MAHITQEIAYDAVSNLLCDIIQNIRQDFTHVDKSWAEAGSDDYD